MLIKLNNGENVTIQAKENDIKSFTLICRGNWIGMREFKKSNYDIAEKFINEFEDYRSNWLMSHLHTESEITKGKIKSWLEFLDRKQQELTMMLIDSKNAPYNDSRSSDEDSINKGSDD